MAVQLEKAGVARHISIDEARKLIDTLEKKAVYIHYITMAHTLVMKRLCCATVV